jgi:diguanylate cyclase (GGDEF)-like protein
MKKTPGGQPRHKFGPLFEPYILIPVFSALLAAVVWTGTYRLIRVESASAEKAALASVNEVVETYDAQMIRNLGTIEQTLKTLGYASRQEGDHAVILQRLNEADLLPSRLIFTVTLMDENGKVTASSDQEVGEEAVSRELAQAASQNKFPYSRRSNITIHQGSEQLHFSHPLVDRNGAPQGRAIVSVIPSYFTSGYDAVRLGEAGMLGLVTDDGRFLVSRTGELVSYGQGLALPPGDLEALEEMGSALQQSPWDGTVRYISARELYKFPLHVIVGLSREEQLSPLAQARQRYLTAAGIVSLLLFGVAGLLARSSWQLQKSRALARKEHETYYAASEASLDAVLVLKALFGKDGKIADFVTESVNRRAAELFQQDRHALVGRHLTGLFPNYQEIGLLDELVQVHVSGILSETEWQNEMPGLSAAWLYRQVVRIEDGMVLILRDITERKQTEEKIIHMAQHDALTGLPNRTLLEERIQQAILHADRNGRCVTIGFMDLDHFKHVNDTLGHKAGDVLLKAVADRVVQCLRKTDSVIRIGGDEFVLILADQAQEGDGLISTLQRISEAISEPIPIEDKHAEVTPSIGLSIYPNDGEDSATLLMRADAALYRAKELGRNNFQFFTEELNTKILEKWSLQERLRGALKRGEFYLVYQPQIDVHTDKIFGLEALIRWNHPEKGEVLPADFISLAEETNAILPIGAWVLETACKQNKELQDAGLAPLIMSVNISARQFLDDVLIEQVTTALQRSGLDPQYLELELTEGMMMHDIEQSISIMHQLQQIGVKSSIDDFGTGYSSLSMLRDFPISRLKIDRSFIKDLPARQNDKAIAKAVTSLGHELGLKVLAEGVETIEQYDFLKSNHCDEIQGFYFSHPLREEELKAMLASRPA